MSKSSTMADAKSKTEDTKNMAPPPDLSFEIKKLHKKALLKLLHCHHSDILLTYPELSVEIGTGEKTKAWQSGAWKDLKKEGYIVPGSKPKTFCLSTEGVELAMCFASEAELAEFRTPLTNEEHHEKIRNKLAKDTHKGKKHRGRDIFNVMLEESPDTSWTRLELASKLGTNPDSHSFFDGFKALSRMGLLTKDGSITKEELVRKFEVLNQKTNKTKKRKASEDEKEEQQQQPQKKQRIRGGTQLFRLSEKAFLVTSSK